jgi:diguanylate cyclase (GGDEF)-like protein
MIVKDTQVSVASSLEPRRLHSATEPHILFPAIAIIVLAMIWWTTLNLIRVERSAAALTATVSARELAETYEAQTVRALREIDQALKFVKYSDELKDGRIALADLKKKGLLPSDLLFAFSIVDGKGKVVASTRPLDQRNLADQNDFNLLRHTDELVVSLPSKNKESAEWVLRFGRQLNAADGTFSGAVMVTVDAAYFVSGYDPSKLGQQGVLGLLGTDGVFRARRSGDTVTAGDTIDFVTMVPNGEDENTRSVLEVNPWDGMHRYTAARQLYDFPLAVIVGLSEDEQLATAHKNTRLYIERAIVGSVVLILVIALLWRMARQLALVRQREAEAKLAYAERVEYLAYHDGLTGLPNRSLFSKLLEQSIHQAHRYHRKLAVLFLDLDRFKQVNDTMGHEAGDELLKDVSVRLKSCLRDSDTVARLGGDEFVVLLPELEDEKYVATVAQKMLIAIARPFKLLGQDFRVTVSIGISVYPGDGEDEQTLKKNADIAMYQAKEEGKNNFQFYSEKLNTNSLERLTLESSLRYAIVRNEFQLYYQAKQDMVSGHIAGMEALLRWQHPDLGTVAPMQFIPIAEETGLIIPIGKWVLMTACRQNVAWQQQGLPRLTMSVNLTARQFNDESLLQDVTAILAESGMDPHLLELEISESMLMHDVDKTLRILRAFKEMGIKIAIDDFGVGYSSLSALKQFPIDTIKIDRSFIRDVASVEEDKDLTAAIIAMGRTLSLTVVAQGVETKEQADQLREQSCDEFQGYYFSRPMPSEQFGDLLRMQPEGDPAP